MYRRKDGLYEKLITIDGKRKAFRGRTEKEVMKKIVQYQGEREKGPLFSAVAEAWQEEHWKTLSENSKKNYNPAYARAVEHFGDEYVRNITAQQINRFIIGFSKGRAQKTVKTQLSIISMVLSYAVLQGYIDQNYAHYVSIPRNLPKRRRDLPSDEDIRRVKENVKKPFGLFAYLVLYTGCRRGEALALQYEDFDFQNNTIAISKSVCYANGRAFLKTPKTESGNRTVILLDKLKKYIPKCKKGFIFAEKDRNMLITEGEFQTLWEHYQKETGVTCTPHCLRHAYATMLFEAGLDVKDAQALMGHANISVTQDIYTHIRNARMKQAAEKLNRFDL